VKNKIQLTKNKYLPSKDNIQTIENLVSNRLPDDYVAFMMEYNDFMPTDPSPYCFKIVWLKENIAPFYEASIGGWEEIKEKINGSIIDAINIMWEPSYELIPPDVIPIGNDGGGGIILLGVKGINYGKIFYWFDGLPFEPGKPNFDNIGFVANSFSGFIDSLYPCEGDCN